MSNEIILTGSTGLSNSILGRATTKVIKLVNAQIRDEKSIAVAIADVDRQELAKSAGFNTTAEWAEKFFGFSKSKVSRYCSITAKFKWTKYTTEQGDNYWDIFTLSQMQEMLKATDEQLSEITPDMTVKDIREFINMITIPAEDEPEENTEDEPEDEPEENTETAPQGSDIVEYNDITVMLSALKKHLLENDSAPVLVGRYGDTFRVMYSA